MTEVSSTQPLTAPSKAGRPRSKRARNKHEKRERIRDATWHLFTTRGYEATTTAQIAKRARVAKGTLFLYAKDKRDLLFLVFGDRIRATVDEQLRTLPRSAPLLDQLLHVFGGLFRMYSDHPEVAREFVAAFPGADGPNARSLDAYTVGFYQQLAELVARAKERGEVGEHVHGLQAASNIFSLYFGSLLLWLGGYASLDSALDPGLRSALELQFDGLRPH